MNLTRRNIWCPQENAKAHENRSSNAWAFTPLKRIYTPPSIKVLFPLNQSKSLFRKFTTNSIKNYSSQYNKNMIYNLSYNTLTEDAYSFLIKGLPFVPTLTKTFKQETNKSWNRFKTCMLTQYFFAITFIITPPPPHPVKRKSSWTSPPFDNPHFNQPFYVHWRRPHLRQHPV